MRRRVQRIPRLRNAHTIPPDINAMNPLTAQNPNLESNPGMCWKFMPKIPVMKVSGSMIVAITLSRTIT